MERGLSICGGLWLTLPFPICWITLISSSLCIPAFQRCLSTMLRHSVSCIVIMGSFLRKPTRPSGGGASRRRALRVFEMRTRRSALLDHESYLRPEGYSRALFALFCLGRSMRLCSHRFRRPVRHGTTLSGSAFQKPKLNRAKRSAAQGSKLFFSMNIQKNNKIYHEKKILT